MSYGRSRYAMKPKYPEISSYQKFLRVKMASVADNTFTEKEIQVPADISEGKVFAIHSIEFEGPELASNGDLLKIQLSLKEEGAEVFYDDRDLLWKHSEELNLSTYGVDQQVKTKSKEFYPPIVVAKDKLFLGVIQKTGGAKEIYLRIGFSLRWMDGANINNLALDQLQ